MLSESQDLGSVCYGIFFLLILHDSGGWAVNSIQDIRIAFVILRTTESNDGASRAVF